MPHLVLLAGGRATRLGHLAENVPKCLVEVNGVPFLKLILNKYAQMGVSEITLCLGHQGEKVVEWIKKNLSKSPNINWRFDGSSNLGTGGAIMAALPELPPRFLVAYADTFLDFDLRGLVNMHETRDSEATMAVFHNEESLDKNNVRYLEGDLIDYQKGVEDDNFEYIDYGLTYFEASSFTQDKNKVSFDLSETLSRLSEEKKLSGFRVSNRFYEIGTPASLQETRDYFRFGKHGEPNVD